MEDLTLEQKILEIRKSVQYLQKSTEGHRYTYVKESDVLAEIRPKMDELGVLLIQDMVSFQIVDGLAVAEFKHEWIDVDDVNAKISCSITLTDQAGDPKKIGGLCTYAMKYHLFKFFNIPMDNEDPDAFQDVRDMRKDPLISNDMIETLSVLLMNDEAIKDNMLKWVSTQQNEKVEDYKQIRISNYRACLACAKQHIKKKKESEQKAADSEATTN